VDSLHDWIASKNGTILRTTDGCATWERFISPHPQLNIVDMRFLNTDYGILWAIRPKEKDRGDMYHMFNDGRDWVKVPFYTIRSSYMWSMETTVLG